MVAPSIHLQFCGGERSSGNVNSVPGLGYAITEYLKNWPNAGEPICKDIFEIPRDSGLLADYPRKVREDFCGGKK
jgi:hypothetical protein